jgi:GDPmannose 4,6-dehydratase
MMEPRRALITGVSGQDGVYLAEHLRAHGREVFGVCRGSPPPRVTAVARVERLDMCDEPALDDLIRRVAPAECYHLAAHHRSSQTLAGPVDPDADEILHVKTNLLATHALLRALRRHQPRARVFLAGSCQMFGSPRQMPQNEDTPFHPEAPYAITKVAAAQLGTLYRDRHGLFCCTGILYNHESPLRGPSFVTGRITREVVEIQAGRRRELVLGDPEAQVDWGFAGDYVQAMRLMLEAESPADHVIATGRLTTVRDFAALAFDRVGLAWKDHLRQDPQAHTPTTRAVYQGDPARIRDRLGWQATTTLADLVSMMVDHHRANGGR